MARFSVMQSGARSSGISCWPQAIQYLIPTDETPSAIHNGVKDLRNTRQASDEDEITFVARINHETYRCENVHDEDEKMIY